MKTVFAVKVAVAFLVAAVLVIPSQRALDAETKPAIKYQAETLDEKVDRLQRQVDRLERLLVEQQKAAELNKTRQSNLADWINEKLVPFVNRIKKQPAAVEYSPSPPVVEYWYEPTPAAEIWYESPAWSSTPAVSPGACFL
jgi:hypothetical protein